MASLLPFLELDGIITREIYAFGYAEFEFQTWASKVWDHMIP